ncbi:hypothetical protein [Salinivibrio kushneri]|uniref:hypothetical protein n=1 Tax=Salinivibrio kushneri TaxID=1908198 RepID=UPI0009858A14|nr:hypothetical protein [Salinivibrio kushneri]OOE61079.1 hypothetical protein BZG18_10120 [Salinivibrio kushneri]
MHKPSRLKSAYNKVMEKLALTPDVSFTRLFAFKLVLGLGIVGAITSMLVIAFCSNLQEDFTYKGFNHFFVVFKFPVSVIAAMLSVIGLIALAHRSEQSARQIKQSAEQIKLSETQNIFTNYYKHIEEFEKYIATNKNINNHLMTSQPDITARDIYTTYFPNSKSGNGYQIEPLFCDKIKSTIIDILNHLKDFYESEHEDTQALAKAKACFLNAFKSQPKLKSLCEKRIIEQTSKDMNNDHALHYTIFEQMYYTLEKYIYLAQFEATSEQLSVYTSFATALYRSGGFLEKVNIALFFLTKKDFSLDRDLSWQAAPVVYKVKRDSRS